MRIVYFKQNRFLLRKWNKITIFLMALFSLLIYSIVFHTTGVEKTKIKRVVKHQYDYNNEAENQTRSQCVTFKEYTNFLKKFGMFDIILTALVPFIVIAISNFVIIIRLKKFKQPSILEESNNNCNINNNNNNHDHNDNINSSAHSCSAKCDNKNSKHVAKKEIRKETPSSLSNKSSAIRNNEKFYFDSETKRKYILNEEENVIKFVWNENCSASNSVSSLRKSAALMNKRKHDNTQQLNSERKFGAERGKKFEIMEDENSITVVSNLGFIYRVRKMKPASVLRNSLIKRFRNNSNLNPATENIECDASKVKKPRSKLKALKVSKRWRMSSASINKAPPPSTATSYLMNRANNDSSGSTSDSDNKTSSAKKSSLHSTKTCRESVKLRRERIYSKTTRTLLMISCMFLVLNTPMFINKLIQFYSSFTQVDEMESIDLMTSTSMAEVAAVMDEMRYVYQLYDKPESIEYEPGSRVKRSGYINRSNYMGKSSSSHIRQQNLVSQKKQQNVTHHLVYNELLERISCYTYYLHISTNCFFYLINFRKLRKLLCKCFSRRC